MVRLGRSDLVIYGALLIFIGFIVAIVALALSTRGRTGKARGGAVLIVGPFPIIFGSDKESARTLLILAIILVVILAGFFVVQLLVPIR